MLRPAYNINNIYIFENVTFKKKKKNSYIHNSQINKLVPKIILNNIQNQANYIK